MNDEFPVESITLEDVMREYGVELKLIGTDPPSPESAPPAQPPAEEPEEAAPSQASGETPDKQRKWVGRKKPAQSVKPHFIPARVHSAERLVRDAEKNERSMALRLRISLIVTSVNVLLAIYDGIGLHWIRGFENAAALNVTSLLLFLTAAGAAYDVLRTGVRQLRGMECGMELLAVLLCILAIPETMVSIRALRLCLCALSSVVLLCVLWAAERRAQSMRISALTLMNAGVGAVSVGRAENAWRGRSAAVCGRDEREALEAMLDAEDPQRAMMRWFVPAAILASTLLAAIGAIIGKIQFFRIWTAMLLACAPIGGILAFVLPYSLTASRLNRMKAALGGWYGARVLRGCDAIFVDDEALFPGQSLKLSGVKVFGRFDSVQVINYCASVLQQIGSHVVDRLAAFDGALPPVQALRYYDEGGVGGEIGPDSVLVGTWNFMKQMGVHMEEGIRIRQALYVSVRGELAGLIALRYEAAPKVRTALEKLSAFGAPLPVLAGTDVLITPKMLRAKFRLPLRKLVWPPLRERVELASGSAEGAESGALLSRPSLEALVSVCSGARSLTLCTWVCLALGVLAALSGVGLLFFRAIGGAFETVSCAGMLLFMCAWALVSGIALLPVLKK